MKKLAAELKKEGFRVTMPGRNTIDVTLVHQPYPDRNRARLEQFDGIIARHKARLQRTVLGGRRILTVEDGPVDNKDGMFRDYHKIIERVKYGARRLRP